MVDTYVIVSAVVAILAIALGIAYQTGALDPVIEQIGIMFFKAKAKAEEKKMEAQGKKEGEDFLSSTLSGFCTLNFSSKSTCYDLTEYQSSA